jgi:hypothetical protein
MTLGRQWRGSTWAVRVMGLLLVILLSLLLDSGRLSERQAANLPLAQAAARADQLTDPALFTEARYARHASQADRHAAFQDHPLALEHFPAGALMPPP